MKNDGMIEKVMNTIYFDPVYGNERGFSVVARDALIIKTQDMLSKKRFMKVIPEPEYTFYVVKDEYRDKYTFPQDSAPLSEVREVKCKYNRRKYEFAKALGLHKEYSEIKKRDFMAFNEWYTQNITNSPYLYQIDVDIRNLYNFDIWKANYKKPKYDEYAVSLKKSFMDIEVYQNDSTIDQGTPMSNPENFPVNVITYMTMWDKTMYVLLLDNLNGLRDAEEVKMLPDKFINEHIFTDEDFDKDINFQIEFLSSEAELLIRFFNLINITKPDFCGIWNMNFDMPYIYARMKKLKLSVSDIVCSNMFDNEFKRVRYDEDKNRNNTSGKKKDLSILWDVSLMSNSTQFYCQMSLYAFIRKRTKLSSYALSFISNLELKYSKLDLSDHDLNIKSAIVDDFKTFLKYSIKDTYLLYKLEQKTTDLDNYLLLCDITNVSQGTLSSIVMTNYVLRELYKQGRVIGNNTIYPSSERFEAAIVAEPDLMDLELSLKILGNDTMVFDNVIDMDLVSLYPSIMQSFNISKSTLDYTIKEISNSETQMYIGNGEDFNSLLQTRRVSIFDIGEKYYGLDSLDTLIRMGFDDL